jgi:hypothetical protein
MAFCSKFNGLLLNLKEKFCETPEEVKIFFELEHPYFSL